MDIANNGDTLTLTSSGPTTFTFPTELTNSTSYGVTVTSQPLGAVCSVTNGSGSIQAANYSGVQIGCVASTYSVGGLLLGLPVGNYIVLNNNTADPLFLTANGNFTFPSEMINDSAYDVTIFASIKRWHSRAVCRRAWTRNAY